MHTERVTHFAVDHRIGRLYEFPYDRTVRRENTERADDLLLRIKLYVVFHLSGQPDSRRIARTAFSGYGR